MALLPSGIFVNTQVEQGNIYDVTDLVMQVNHHENHWHKSKQLVSTKLSNHDQEIITYSGFQCNRSGIIEKDITKKPVGQFKERCKNKHVISPQHVSHSGFPM